MKLFSLELVNEDDWNYDTYIGFVIRARDEASARALAVQKSKDMEWNDAARTRCVELDRKGPEEIVLDSFRAG